MTPKHPWTLNLNYLFGLTADRWWQLLRRHRVDPIYWHRAAAITLLSGVNTLYRQKEEQRFGQAVRATAVPNPVLIIGHWRSGTTHLLNLLCLDETLISPNAFQVASPYTFLTTEATLTRRFVRLMPSKRPMDNMPTGYHLPQELEFALALMTTHSPYLGMSFPRHQEHYLKYMRIDESSLWPEAIVAWEEALRFFLKKLSFKYPGRLPLLKSPCNTARIKRLLDLFPQTRFIHIVRHPYQVFLSTRHLYQTLAWYIYLQRPPDGLDAFILRQYQTMYAPFFQERALIPDGQYCQVRYEALARDPYGVMEGIYRQLNLGDFKALTPRLERYLQTIGAYQTNAFPELPQELRDRVYQAWQQNFWEWGYS